MRSGASPELLLAENDRTFNAVWVLGVDEGSFARECGATDCGERLSLTLIEYAARDDGQVLLACGHAMAAAVPSSLLNPDTHVRRRPGR
jgi:hypothetical protein